MDFLRYFFPEKIHFPDSKYNKNISLMRFTGSVNLFSDGLVESGNVMTTIWKKGIKSLLPKPFSPQKVLLLGLAGGCNARLINHLYPEAEITAVEIDPVMVEIGKKYFNLEKIKNLNLVIADALDFVHHLTEESYDLVMVDCFVGQVIPEKLESVNFFKKLKKHSRFVLVNRLWWYKERQKTLGFFKTISPHFFFIKTHTLSNVVISLV